MMDFTITLIVKPGTYTRDLFKVEVVIQNSHVYYTNDCLKNQYVPDMISV